MQFIRRSRKAIAAVFPYAVWQQRKGKCKMFDTFLSLITATGPRRYMWRHVEPFISTLLHEESDNSLKLAAVLTSPLFPWQQFSHPKHSIKLWVAAASILPYTDEIGWRVVDALLCVAYQDTLRHHIPVDMWSWLNKRPSLPPVCPGRRWGSSRDIVRTLRRLGDAEILTSYLILVWSEWDGLDSEGLEEMHTAIQRDLKGTPTMDYHKDLLQHLDHVLGQLGLGLEHLGQRNPHITETHIQLRKGQYKKLEETLRKAGGMAVDDSIYGTPIGSSSSVHSMHSRG